MTIFFATGFIFASPYPQEWNDAYLRSYNLGITTVPKSENADVTGVLYRKFAAKMASEFALKVWGRTPDENRKCTFKDIDKESQELQYYIGLSCKLGIMGLNYYGDSDDIFNPNYVVTRDQFVTILSRILFGDTYNIQPQELTFFDQVKNFFVHTLTNISTALGLYVTLHTPFDWYTKHLAAIKKLGVMTDSPLTIKETRGYVMLIMYRLHTMGIEKITTLVESGMKVK